MEQRSHSLSRCNCLYTSACKLVFIFKIQFIFLRSIIQAVFLLCLVHSNTYGQTQEYLFSYIGMKDGLLEETVTTVQQDSTGYIWIASQNALQRYDGKRFLNFTHRATD